MSTRSTITRPVERRDEYVVVATYQHRAYGGNKPKEIEIRHSFMGNRRDADAFLAILPTCANVVRFHPEIMRGALRYVDFTKPSIE